jgi:VIT1/CCC1 family predicted Fe2+/Mn2+ transporter
MGSRDDQSASVTAKASFDLYGCKIERDDIERLWTKIKDGFPAHSHINISTEYSTGGIASTVSGQSVEDVIEGVRQSSLAGGGTAINNLDLYISCSKRSSFDKEDDADDTPRTIAVYIKPTRITASIRGENAEWVSGRAARLRELLTTTRIKWVIGFPRRMYLISVGTVIGSVTGLFTSFPIKDRYTSVFVSIACVFLFTGIGALATFVTSRRERIRLVLLSPTQRRERDWVNIGVLIVSVVVMILTIAAILIAHQDAISHG